MCRTIAELEARVSTLRLEVLFLEMMNHRRRIGVVSAALLSFAAAACDNAEEAALTTVATTPSTASSQSASSTTTTEILTTTVATTALVSSAGSTASSTVPTDTTVPISTEPDIEAAKQAVIAAANEANSAFRALEQNPSDPVALERWRAAVDGETEQFQLQLLVEMIASEMSTVPNPTAPSVFVVKLDSVVVNLQSGTATLESCEVNSWVMIRRDSATGTSVTADDSIRTVVSSGTFTLIDGQWQKTGGSQLSSTEGAGECVG